MKAAITSLAIAALAAASCGKSSDPAPRADKPSDPPPTPPSVDAATAPSGISEADARAHLETWLAAQNSGDFDSYAKLYADGFKGIKRTGKRTKAFDRGGWLADRRRMFAKPMRVDAARVVVNHNDKGATLQFVQTWSSDTYEDTGPKRMCLIQRDGSLVISHEEMLESHATPALDEWVEASAEASEVTVNAPRSVRVEVERLATGLLLEDEKVRSIAWTMAMGPTLVFQFSSAPIGDTAEVSRVTSYLVLARRDGDRFVSVDSATIEGGSFSLTQTSDIDADGERDLVFRWREKRGDASKRGLAFILSKSHSVTVLALGETGDDWGVDLKDLCIANVGSGRYLLAALQRWTENNGERRHKPLVRAFDIGAALGETRLFGTAIAGGATVTEALESAAASVPINGLADPSEPGRSTRVRACGGNPDPLLVMPASADVASAAIRYQVVRGLDENEREARRKAKRHRSSGARRWSQPVR